MRVYEPTVVDGELRFVANVVSVQQELIALGELMPKRGEAPDLGTPIHSLLIHVDGAQTLFELNDQGNTRDMSDVDRVELTPTSLRVVFAAGRGPTSGRVLLSPKVEIFDRDGHERRQLRSVRVYMNPTAAQLAQLKLLLPADKLVDTTTAMAQ